jgi:hypothetical protein
MDWQGHHYVGESTEYTQWIEGYITGLNLSGDEAHQVMTDWPGIDLWLTHWCDAHPAASLVEAVSAFTHAPGNTRRP